MKKHLDDKIKHVVVLMMENRSFDHVLGNFPGVNGIQEGQYNLLDPTKPNGKAIKPYAIDVLNQPNFCPGHSFPAMMTDIFGPNATGCISGAGLNVTTPLYPTQTMSGFVKENANQKDGDNYPVMSYFKYLPEDEPGRLHVMHSLAENFLVCDNWFCDTPSETVPNRLFMHAATNMGYNNDDSWPGYENPVSTTPNESNLYSANTIYEQLDTLKTGEINWAMYGFPQDEYDSGMFAYTAALPQANRSIFDFPVDVLTGNLPFYTFIMPSLLFGTGSLGGSANGNSMHPNGDIRLGENLLASVYNILRNSPLWEHTLLIINFDENGGCYDHVMPPAAIPPDGINYPPDGKALFDYSILGPRIPAILVSPWLSKGVDSTQYQNTSVLRFVQDLFAARCGVTAPSLTQRDLNANSFAANFSQAEPRKDCPQSISLYSDFPNWGTELTDPNGDNIYGGPNIPGLSGKVPSSSALDFAKSYCPYYPGHPDSGKALDKEFSSHAELVAYMQERRRAAKEFYKNQQAAQ